MSLLLFAIVLGLYAESDVVVDPRQEAARIALEDILTTPAPFGYEITEINFYITGNTLAWALANRLEIEVGDFFASSEELVAKMRDQNQILTNQRVLESGWVNLTLQPRSGSPTAVVVDVYAKDTFNLIALPYPKYDSNSGLLLGVRARNYNFLGTMEPLRLNLDYRRTEDAQNEWTIDTNFTFPFQWQGYDWTWRLDESFAYTEGEFDISLGTDLAISLPLWPDTWELNYSQDYDYESDDEYFDYNWLTSGLSFSTSIPTGLVLPVFREIKYAPSIFTNYSYWPGEILSDQRRGVEPGFSQALKAGRVDWIGNFRNGAEASISNSNSYNLSVLDWDRRVAASISGYLAADPFAFSGRLGTFYWFDTYDDEAASYVRGIRDTYVEGDVGFYFNSDVTLKVWTIGNFVEGQGSIFVDMLAAWRRELGFEPDENFKIGVGIEAIGFPLFARSWYMRVSLGFDLLSSIAAGTIRGASRREIFIGFGYHY